MPTQNTAELLRGSHIRHLEGRSFLPELNEITFRRAPLNQIGNLKVNNAQVTSRSTFTVLFGKGFASFSRNSTHRRAQHLSSFLRCLSSTHSLDTQIIRENRTVYVCID
jgi:hypothetical protein